MAGVKFVDKDTVSQSDLSNASGFLPMWQDNGALKVPVSMLRMQAVASCKTDAATQTKVATISNMPDFELRNGLIITVAFTYANTASAPMLNINEKGAYALRCENQVSSVTVGSGCWGAGAILTVQYVEVDSSHKYFLMLGHDIASVDSSTGITTYANGTTEYNKQSVDSVLNSALAPYRKEYLYKSISVESLTVDLSTILVSGEAVIGFANTDGWGGSGMSNAYTFMVSRTNNFYVFSLLGSKANTSLITLTCTTAGVLTIGGYANTFYKIWLKKITSNT